MVKDGVIKFTQSSSTREVTNIDIGILELKTNIENLENSILHIQRQIDEYVSIYHLLTTVYAEIK